MIFTSLTLLSGMILFSNAAPWYIPPAPVTHCVNVSNDSASLIFDPPYIDAAPGDQVEFKFHIKNHSVTQSTFNEPCTPLPYGADTGFMAVSPGTPDNDLPVQKFTVIDESPVWIYCRQDANTAASHCGKGMVFSINPGSNDSDISFAAYQNNAKAIGEQLQLASNDTNQLASNSTNQTASIDTDQLVLNCTVQEASNGTYQMVSNGTNQLVINCTEQTTFNDTNSNLNETISLDVGGSF
ncbi:hypothetical protein BGY98DRAFT_933392 [Russula aff. rugulosa BPL654]|nr:hypothetical protein BGY98DRAFT_933392 [Russula aff. rugulosa BPL654]